jgi:enoyl-CoA hydratase
MSSAQLETLRVDVEHAVARVTVNRPDKRNALNAVVRRELVDVLDSLRAREDVGAFVLTGAGDKAFVAGADIAEFADRTPVAQWQAMTSASVFDALAAFPKPTIAMINGFALGGGCELALACDLRVAARSARLGQPEIKLGILPGGGASQRLPRLVGAGKAMWLILTGEIIGAEEAERIGLVDRVFEDAELADRTMELARSLAAGPPLAMRLAKAAVRMASEAPLTAGLAFEREAFVTAFASEDRIEGMRAFLEKRPPRFRGE